MLLLLAVPLVGSVGGGARRWIDLGPVSIQPSEMVKVVVGDRARALFPPRPSRPATSA